MARPATAAGFGVILMLVGALALAGGLGMHALTPEDAPTAGATADEPTLTMDDALRDPGAAAAEADEAVRTVGVVAATTGALLLVLGAVFFALARVVGPEGVADQRRNA